MKKDTEREKPKTGITTPYEQNKTQGNFPPRVRNQRAIKKEADQLT